MGATTGRCDGSRSGLDTTHRAAAVGTVGRRYGTASMGRAVEVALERHPMEGKEEEELLHASYPSTGVYKPSPGRVDGTQGLAMSPNLSCGAGATATSNRRSRALRQPGPCTLTRLEPCVGVDIACLCGPEGPGRAVGVRCSAYSTAEEAWTPACSGGPFQRVGSR